MYTVSNIAYTCCTTMLVEFNIAVCPIARHPHQAPDNVIRVLWMTRSLKLYFNVYVYFCQQYTSPNGNLNCALLNISPS